MKSHRFDPWSFSFGLIILVVGLFFLTTTDPFDLAGRLETVWDLGLPILALLIGAALVFPALRRPKQETPAPLSPEETMALQELNDSVPPAS